MSNGLRLMILTNAGQIIMVEAHNVLSSECIRETMGQVGHKYDLDSIIFTRVYPVNGTVVA